MTATSANRTIDDRSTNKVFVRQDGSATITCPACTKLKIISADKFRKQNHRLQVRCSCSHHFTVDLDFRQYYRRPTCLKGNFTLDPPEAGYGSTLITDISLSGVRFRVNNTSGLTVGKQGHINFKLDNKSKTRLSRNFTIRSISENSIGCEFQQDNEFDKVLGFYMRFGP